MNTRVCLSLGVGTLTLQTLQSNNPTYLMAKLDSTMR